MATTIKAEAKHDCSVYYMREPNGLSFERRRLIKGETLVMEMVCSHKIEDKLIAAILGEKNVILKDNDKFNEKPYYVSTYSNDFNYTKDEKR